MADRFWIGNNGNLSDTAHWSTSSGGAGGASVPTSADNAKFDALSFTLPGQTVTVSAMFDCLDFDWTGATNAPTLAGTQIVNIYGHLVLINSMPSVTATTFAFRSTTTGKTVTTAGKTLNAGVSFIGVGGGWTLQDNLTITGILNHTGGTFVTNDKTINCSTFGISGSAVRTATLGNSIINMIGFNASDKTNLTFTSNTAKMTVSGTNQNFNGGGLTYYDLTIAGIITIIGSNSFNTLTITTGKTLKLTSGTTQSVTSLVCNGTLANPSTLQSVTSASAATIALPSGRYFIRHASIKDITISGATAVTSIAGTNVSGNTGITFATKFETGRIKNDGSLNWYSTATGAITKVSG